MGAETAYRVAELRDDETAGFCPRGAVREMWHYRGHEGMVAGPAETGKTFGCLYKLNALLWKYPEAQAVIGRKIRATMFGSVLQTYQRVAAKDGWDKSPIKRYGGEEPQWYDYPNGSRLWVAGLDNPGKALSSERAFIYINQAEEIDVNDWETLLTRATGRGIPSHIPYTQVFGDCNPGPPTHWILHRPSLKVFYAQHTDNPTLYTDDGRITEQGKISIGILSALTGLRRERLYSGKWVQAEGGIYEEYNRIIHVLPPVFAPKSFKQTWWSVDFGFIHPFSWGEWGADSDKRLYLARELYLTHTKVQDCVTLILRAVINDLPEKRPTAIVADHDAEDRETFEAHCWFCHDCEGADTFDGKRGKAIRKDDVGIHTARGHKVGYFDLTTKPARKAVKPGIQAVGTRLAVAGDGRPRLFFIENSLIHPPDEYRVAARNPTRAAEEIEGYIWEPPTPGRPAKEQPKKEDDDAMDMTRYVVAEVDGVAVPETPKKPSAPPLIARPISWPGARSR